MKIIEFYKLWIGEIKTYTGQISVNEKERKKKEKKSIKIKAKSLNRQMNSATTRSTASTIGLIERNRSPNTI